VDRTIERLREYLLPGRAEDDLQFRSELLSLAHLSLVLVGALLTVVPLLMLAAGLGVVPVELTDTVSRLPNLALTFIGLATLAAAKLTRQAPRLLAGISIWLSVVVLDLCALAIAAEAGWADHYMFGYITLVMFGSAALPYRPLHVLALGLAITIAHLSLWAALGPQFAAASQAAILLVVTTAACALTAIVYRNRLENHRTHRQALQASEDLRQAQARLLISDSAATMGRMAAALSHELNSPIGALASAVDTLGLIAEKQEEAPSPKLAELARETANSGRKSAARLKEIVARMQRFTNLDRAEIQAADLNELIRDVVALLDAEVQIKAAVELELMSLPRYACRPQQMSAVLSNLIGNAVEAVDPVERGGRVRVASSQMDGRIEIIIEDNGRGIPPDQLREIFNPGTFTISGERVAASNWGMFSCRQIVQEHGGDIVVTSEPGAGTTVRIELPQSGAIMPV
jgi:signal transduction histidine kinase